MATAGEVKPDQVADEVGLLFGPLAHEAGHPSHQLLPGGDSRVAVQYLKAIRQHVVQQSKRNFGHLFRSPALKQPDHLRTQIYPFGKLIQQARFAHPGLACDRHRPRFSTLDRQKEGLLQLSQLDLPSDHASLDPLHATCRNPEGARLGTLHQIHRHGFGEALGCDRIQRPHIEDASHVSVGIAGDQQASRWGSALHPRGQVDGEAHHRVPCLGDPTCDHQSRVDPHPHAEAWKLSRDFQFSGIGSRHFQYPKTGPHRLFGIVLTGHRDAKNRLEAIAHETGDPPAVLFNWHGQALQGPVHHLHDLFRIQTPAHLSRTDDVSEQEGGQLALLIG